MDVSTPNRQWILAKRPVGAVQNDDFKYVNGKISELGDGDVLIRMIYFGYDASQRIWLTETGGYMNPIMPGDAMRCMGIGRVVSSKHPEYTEGDFVEGFASWEDYAVVRADGPMPLRKLPQAGYPLSWNLGVMGVGGLTAYYGVTDGLKIKAGDTVVISAATGATGSIATQICKILGATVIGIAGGPDKCKWILENAGCDYAIDYKNDDISEKLREIAPQGVDAYFDNVGGAMLEEMLLNMANKGRVLICGEMSTGYTGTDFPGPQNFMRICTHQLTVQGILLFNYANVLHEGAMQIGEWVQQGKINVAEDVQVGFEKAPELLPTIFTGKAPGKLVLKVAEENE